MKKVSLLVTMGLASVALFSCSGSNSDKKSDAENKTADENKKNTVSVPLNFAGLVAVADTNAEASSISYDLKCEGEPEFVGPNELTLNNELNLPSATCAIKINTLTIVTTAHAPVTHTLTSVNANSRLTLLLRNGNISPSSNDVTADEHISGTYNYTNSADAGLNAEFHIAGILNARTDNTLKFFRTAGVTASAAELLSTSLAPTPLPVNAAQRNSIQYALLGDDRLTAGILSNEGVPAVDAVSTYNFPDANTLRPFYSRNAAGAVSYVVEKTDATTPALPALADRRCKIFPADNLRVQAQVEIINTRGTEPEIEASGAAAGRLFADAAATFGSTACPEAAFPLTLPTAAAYYIMVQSLDIDGIRYSMLSIPAPAL